MTVDKVIGSAAEAVADVHNGARIAVGGFGLAGIPWILIEALLEQGADNLTIVSNNCGVDGAGLGLLLERRRISRVIASYIGENKEFARQYLAGELTVELAPQGHPCRANAGRRRRNRSLLHPDRRRHPGCRGRPSLAVHPDGTVAMVSPPKEVRTFHGKQMILEESIVTDVALVRAAVV
jgi:3-oxoacid CoA-transferase subunit A